MDLCYVAPTFPISHLQVECSRTTYNQQMSETVGNLWVILFLHGICGFEPGLSIPLQLRCMPGEMNCCRHLVENSMQIRVICRRTPQNETENIFHY